ncbi:MAG: hypothetical protein QOD72_2540, partial [Acidimicrobiaceae bacterium]|nr:hypothetical protein [Acidimicrobiaceae bacterium]
MTSAVYVPLLLAAVMALVAPRLTHRLAPGSAAWTLALTSVVAAVAMLASLGLLAWPVVAELPPVAELGKWRPGAVASASPVPTPVAAVALAVLVLLAWRLVHRAADVVDETRTVFRMERRLPSRHGPARLVLVDDPVPVAHALAGLPRCGGHIVVSTGILETLDDAELRHAVYEHERAHLRHHHAALRLLADLAVAVNPLLKQTHRQTVFLLERWADEDAAKATSRAATAEALATVSLATISMQHGLAFHVVGVPARVDALLAAAPTSRLRAVIVAITLTGLCAIAA